MNQKRKKINYSKWGYIFILPFFAAFFIFSFIPLVDTIRYSFYEYYRSGIKEIGPNFIGMDNYTSLLQSDMLKYARIVGHWLYSADCYCAAACVVVCGCQTQDSCPTVF